MSSIVLCNSNGKQTQLYWVFFVKEHSGNFTKHWNLNEFRYIYITLRYILLFLNCSIHIYFPI